MLKRSQSEPGSTHRRALPPSPGPPRVPGKVPPSPSRSPATPPQVRGPSLGRFIFWLLPLGALLVYQMATRGDDADQLTYSEFNKQVDQNNVAAVEINPESHQLEGTLKKPITRDGSQSTTFRVTLPFADPEPLVQRLEARGVQVEGKGGTSTFGQILLSLLPWLLIAGFWLLIIRQMRTAGSQALAFGRARTAAVSPETPKVTFADVADVEEAKAELQEIVAFLKEPQKFQRLGGRLPKGILLVGPPGSGKTLLARATAGEAGRPFLSISGSDFVELFVGVGASRVRDLFEQGKANAPCIIFIDELDAVGRLRGVALGGGAHEEREQTLNQLLVEMDGFEPNEGIVLLSATNRPDVLDPALLRPGRFDRRIVVDLPDVKGREQILRIHAAKVQLAPEVDLAAIARGTPGMSGADLANLVNEAALLAARHAKEHVEQKDFDDARDKVTLGIERRSLVLTEADRRLSAYHEGGHALVNVLTPGLDPVQKVTIVPRGHALGVTFSPPEEDRKSYTKEYLFGRLAVAQAGRAAEEIVFGENQVTSGSSHDLAQATELARQMISQFGMSDAVGPVTVSEREATGMLGIQVTRRGEVSDHTLELVDKEIRRILIEALDHARGLIRSNLDRLHAIARSLLENETLDRASLEKIVLGPVPTEAAFRPVAAAPDH